MSEKFSRIKGVADLFEPESLAYTHIEDNGRKIFSRYGFQELRTPILEYTTLFQRGIGTETDVVQKEMFSFMDSKGRSMSMRPEATAGVIRAAIEAGLARPGQVSRLFTWGPMFRHERPQKGRMRQFHQINCECLGTESPYADAELICMLLEFLKSLEIRGLTLKLNSLGCAKCRPHYHEALRKFMAGVPRERLCANCQRRLETNPLRLLDCKEAECKSLLQNVPHLEDHICGDCREHFETVRHLLESRKIVYEIDHYLVRGLDYYCRTTFEVTSDDIGSQTAVAGGGRYDGLVKQLGGDDVPGVGFACGMERLTLLMNEIAAPVPVFFVIALDDSVRDEAFGLTQDLRDANFSGEMGWQSTSLKSQLRQASKTGARFCIIIGSEEAQEGSLTMKDMRDGVQKKVFRNRVVSWLNDKLYENK